jgi:hypothetical protein
VGKSKGQKRGDYHIKTGASFGRFLFYQNENTISIDVNNISFYFMQLEKIFAIESKKRGEKKNR